MLSLIYLILHSTRALALRTHLFFTGNPYISFTTGIIDDELHNKIDKQILDRQNAKCYTITKPAFERATHSKLGNYIVRRKGFLYFAEYYGEA